MPLIVLSAAEHHDADFELDPTLMASLWRMEEGHFWHAARNRWIAHALMAHGVTEGARILDVGCGGGSVAVALHRLGYRVTGIDTAEMLVRKAHERCPEATFVVGRVESLPPQPPFDVITLFDVLEHLDDPAGLLRASLAHARPGTLILATVPALRSLFTLIDTLSGHKKRYEPGELADLFGAVGLEDIEERGIFRAVWPLLRIARWRAKPPHGAIDRATRQRILLADTRIPAFPLNGLLGLLCRLELRLGFGASSGRPGPSLLAAGRVARSPARSS